MTFFNKIIIRFLRDCDEAKIKDPVEYIRSKIHVFNWLKGCFPRDILPTDGDGEVEINGRFLRFEFKHESVLQSGKIAIGQRRAMEALIRTGFFTILVIGTNDAGEITCCEEWHHTGKIAALKSCDQTYIQDFCRRWSAYVEKSRG